MDRLWVRDIAKLFKDFEFNKFINDPGSVYKLINDHHQLRWLADGVNRMAMGAIINALWDAWAKVEKTHVETISRYDTPKVSRYN